MLAEFYVVSTRKLAKPLAEREAASSVAELAKLLVVPVDSSFVRKASELSKDARLSLWDTLIVEAAMLGGCSRIVTEDLAHGTMIRGLSIEDPFQDAQR